MKELDVYNPLKGQNETIRIEISEDYTTYFEEAEKNDDILRWRSKFCVSRRKLTQHLILISGGKSPPTAAMEKVKRPLNL